MNCETTMYIQEDLLLKVDDAAEKLGLSRSRVVSILLTKYMDSQREGGRAFVKLRYQERDREVNFVTKSLSLREDVYEMWVDVRKVFKLSASLVIARAIMLYLDEILNGEDGPFNYFPMYYTNVRYHGKTCIITTIWGEPDEKTIATLLLT